MPYASHRIAGVLELEPTCTLDESNQIKMWRSLTKRTDIRHRIGLELAESRSLPQVAFEPSVTVDSETLQRELEAELASYLANHVSVALS